MFDVYSYERFNDLIGDTLVATVMNEQEAEQLLKQHNCYDYAESESVILRKYNGKIFREVKEA